MKSRFWSPLSCRLLVLGLLIGGGAATAQQEPLANYSMPSDGLVQQASLSQIAVAPEKKPIAKRPLMRIAILSRHLQVYVGPD